MFSLHASNTVFYSMILVSDHLRPRVFDSAAKDALSLAGTSMKLHGGELHHIDTCNHQQATSVRTPMALCCITGP